jgi:hypothetical protein
MSQMVVSQMVVLQMGVGKPQHIHGHLAIPFVDAAMW